MGSVVLRRVALGSLVLACGVAMEPTADTGPGSASLVALPPMRVARFAHTATPLPDGRVLVAGGSGSDASATAEIFDPGTRRFLPTQGLLRARGGHTATSLPDGRVLIAGGYDGTWLASTEIYDPASGTFTRGPDLTEPRSDHLAIPLRDRRVLFVGGTSTGYSFLASAEVFDPATMRFTRTGAMSFARESHVGALLPNGRVLIAGGHAGRRESIRLYDGAELYDPEQGAFRTTGSMTRPRHKHAAAILPDGRVLITGGSDERDDRGQYRDAEIYDPQSERFSSAGELRRARYKHQGTMTPLVDGRILVAGGAGDPELFDPVTARFTLVSSSNALAANFSTATRLENGHVLIVGGYGNGTAARNAAWLFIP